MFIIAVAVFNVLLLLLRPDERVEIRECFPPQCHHPVPLRVNNVVVVDIAIAIAATAAAAATATVSINATVAVAIAAAFAVDVATTDVTFVLHIWIDCGLGLSSDGVNWIELLDE